MVDELAEDYVLTMSSLLIHECRMLFRLLRSLISFSDGSDIFQYYTFFPNYFTYIIILISGIVFLISFLDHLLVVYRNAINFCILILCFVTLLNLCISSNRVLGGRCEFLSIFYMQDHITANRDTFTSLFPIWMIFKNLFFLA